MTKTDAGQVEKHPVLDQRPCPHQNNRYTEVPLRKGCAMWICFKEGFVSAVQNPDDPDDLVVRARNVRHLEALFPNHEIVMSPDADYACRAYIPKTEFGALLARKSAAIDYQNFKASVMDRRLHQLYAEFWRLHLRYQWSGGV
ncbi:hypothetical protein DBIPINDM_002412 [Mesorhizobium sp. AR02]|uniref:hypothetical protein n=1 Tax=Mesorhizobium sp. AR02 TaxID=2865837 RepID=UPI002160779F|nr:hypothetical protein [Mesorhizobium sp. AR02]UVK55849.1 hypothetical protein DBIPINDM_002412 [Mesorhizobium sp. AR02]